MRKWLLHAEMVGDPGFQIVVPIKFRSAVLKVALDESVYSDIRKTYDLHFFWPGLKKGCFLFAASEPFEHLIIDDASF